MCNFRLLLINDSIEIQNIIMNIVKQIVHAAQEDFKIKNSNIVGGNRQFNNIFLNLFMQLKICYVIFRKKW